MANKTFRRGQSTYICNCCGRNTRDTHGEGHTQNCYDCYELAGWENHLSDNGEEGLNLPVIQDHFDSLIKKGVKEDTLVKQFPDLWELAMGDEPDALMIDEAGNTIRESKLPVAKNAKYVYPAGLTQAQKKVFRAKARRKQS